MFLDVYMMHQKGETSRFGKLNIYMAVDISPSMDTEGISAAIDIILKLTVKV